MVTSARDYRFLCRGRVTIDNVARCLPTTDWTAEEAGACSTPILSAAGTRHGNSAATAAEAAADDDDRGHVSVPSLIPPLTLFYPR